MPLRKEQQLGGYLTHGSVLVGNSTGSAPHPIYRAVWLREAILGDEVRDPPAEVPALADSAGDAADEAVTIQALLRKHRQQASCAECHDRLDPWGIPFERYSAAGRFEPRVPKAGVRVPGFDRRRHKDLANYLRMVDGLRTVEVDAKARLPRGPEVNGMRALKRFLLEERRDDIARNLLSYAIGRRLTPGDRAAVAALFAQSKSSGHGVRAMIVAICKSPIFRGRALPE